MKYITNVALAVGGERHDRGSEIELTSEQAEMYDPADITPVDDIVEEEPPTEPSIDDPDEMTLAQLKERAKALGLSTAGSKADLLDRIKLQPVDAQGDDDNEAGLNPTPADDDINNPIP